MHEFYQCMYSLSEFPSLEDDDMFYQFERTNLQQFGQHVDFLNEISIALAELHGSLGRRSASRLEVVTIRW